MVHPADVAFRDEMIYPYNPKAFIEESLTPEWIGSTGQGFMDEAAEADLGDYSC